MRGAAASLLLLLAVLAPGGAGGAGPQFSRRQRTAERARPGAAAALRCRVLHLSDRAVSWIRSSDLQILTHAGTVFTADARVSAITGAAEQPSTGPQDPRDPKDDLPDDWEEGGPGPLPQPGEETVHTLRIERLRAADSGRYECQINTEPKMSLFFNLTVSDARSPPVEVRALGPRALAAAAGGSASLACEAHYVASADALAALPPLRIRWQHAGRQLDDQSLPGGVSLSAERWAGGARSRLTLGGLRRRHAGAWRCSVPGGADTVTLAVTAHREEADSMQRDQAEARESGAVPQTPRALLLAALLALLALLAAA